MIATSMLHRISQRQWLRLYCLFALLMACIIMYHQHGWVNNDSLLYFEQARLIAAGEWRQAYELFRWLFYPGLIAGLHLVSHLSIHTAAQCINAACFVLFVAGFQQLLLASGAKMRTLHWGHLLLFSTPYLVGDVLGMLLRDEGFWAAFTWGLVYMLRYLNSHSLKHALAYQCCLLIAMLFRIEGAAYLILLPTLCLCQRESPVQWRLQQWLKANLLALAGLILLLMALVSGHLHPAQLGRLQEVVHHVTYLFSDIGTVIAQKAEVMGKQVLGPYLDDFARFSVWSSLLLIVVYKSLNVAGLPVLASLLWPKRRWWQTLPAPTRQLATATYAIGLLISVVTLLNVFVLSSRYVIAGGIVMLWLASFAVADLQKRWPRQASRLLMLVLALMLLSNLWPHASTDTDRLAVNYIASINPLQKPVFYDTENARFYAKKPYQNRVPGVQLLKEIAEQSRLADYDIYMISIRKDDVEYETYANSLMQQHCYALHETIYGWRKKNKVLIYQKHPSCEHVQP